VFLQYELLHKLRTLKNLRALWRWPGATAETCRSIN